MKLIDTHCHIHDSEFASKFDKSPAELLKSAADAGIVSLVCVGTDVKSSREAVEFCARHDSCYATVALHPHEAADKELPVLKAEFNEIEKLTERDVVAIGECGLDYYYHKTDDTRQKQQEVFRWHVELAQGLNLPLVFHVRDAFDDFLSIVDEYPGLRGVVHSFSAGTAELTGVLERGFYVGLNGIMTFTKDDAQLEAARLVPIEKLVLETDAPFLTPVPFRGRINEPKHVINITQFLAELRGESQALLAKTTTKNAKKLFNL